MTYRFYFNELKEILEFDTEAVSFIQAEIYANKYAKAYNTHYEYLGEFKHN